MNRIDEISEIDQKVIVLFTSNFQGGILQFTFQMCSVLQLLGYKVVVFIPDNANIMETSNHNYTVNKYKKFKALALRNRNSKIVASEIEKFDPRLVMFCDSGILSTQVLLSLNRRIITSMNVHDVIPHLEKTDIYEWAKQIFKEKLFDYALNFTNQIIMLSANSYRVFQKKYPSYIGKATWMPIGAHVPAVIPQKPKEFEGANAAGYYLFFGRISKYKGIKNLLKAYNSWIDKEKPMLIIAGGGEFDIEEKGLINHSNTILIINRFIRDEEMVFLIKNSRALILPYIEASQSGVIPIAYHFGIPVITSNVPGLVEFVDRDISGMICSNVHELKEAMMKMRDESLRQSLSVGARRFYEERLDWNRNIQYCIESLVN